MQVVVFDKKFQCFYRLRNIPKDGDFEEIVEELKLTGKGEDYEILYFSSNDYDLCIDEYNGNGKKLVLTASTCN